MPSTRLVLRQEARDLPESLKRRLQRYRRCRFSRLFLRRSRKKVRRNSPSNSSSQKKNLQLSPNQRKSSNPLKPNTCQSDTRTAHASFSWHNSSCRRFVRLRAALQAYLTIACTSVVGTRV